MKKKKNIIKVLMILIAVVISGSVYTGHAATVQAAKKPARITVKKITSPSAGKIKVTWKKVSKVSKYQVQVASNKKFTKGKLTKTVLSSKSSVTISKLTQGKKYYVRVRACRITKGKKYYGKWSKVNYITVKKKKTQGNNGGADKKPNNSDDERERNLSVLQSKVWLRVYVNPPRNSLYDSDVYPYKYLYTGRAIEPKVQRVQVLGDYYDDLVAGTDYTVSYKDNVNAGTGKIILKGIGKFYGSAVYDFTIVSTEVIRKDLSAYVSAPTFLNALSLSNSSLPAYISTGDELMPKIMLRDYRKNTFLIRGQDYELSYRNNVNPGKAEVTITGIGRYKGSITSYFMIVSAEDTKTELSTCANVIFAQGTASQSYVYMGEEIKPAVAVRLFVFISGTDPNLVCGKDYEVSYKDNVNPGEATVIITGIGQYKGSLTKNFTISKAQHDIITSLDSDVVYVGETRKIDVSGNYYGDLEFSTTEEGIAEISSDGMITGLREGVTTVYVNISGDVGHEACKVKVGRVTVLDEAAVIYGFYKGNVGDRTDCPYKNGIVNAGNSDGTQTYKIEFDCSLDTRWLDDNVTFEVEDVTPLGYSRMFADLDVPYAAPEITSVDEGSCYGIYLPYKDGEGSGLIKPKLYISGKMLTIEAGAGVRAIKVSAKKDGEVLDYIYLTSNGRGEDGNTTEFDFDLYRQVRKCMEAELWTEDMSSLEKLQVLADYICKTAHYPKSVVTDKEYNPTYWSEWSVDNAYLKSTTLLPLDCAAILQGGMVDCWAVHILMDVAVEDLGLKALAIGDDNWTIEKGEGVFLAMGNASSNPTIPSHKTLKYKNADEERFLIDAQGLGGYLQPSDNGVTCEAHGCKSKIVPLKHKHGDNEGDNPQAALKITDAPEQAVQGTTFNIQTNRAVKVWEISNGNACNISENNPVNMGTFLANEAGDVTITAVSEDGQTAECSVTITSLDWMSGKEITLSESEYDSSLGTAQITDIELVMDDSITVEVLSHTATEKFELQYSKDSDFYNEFLSRTTYVALEPTEGGFVFGMWPLGENCTWYFRCRPYRIENGRKVYGNWGETKELRIPRYSAESDQPPKYSYSAHVLNPYNLYEKSRVVVYVKTENPNPGYIDILCDDISCVCNYIYVAKDGTSGNIYWDIKYKSDKDLNHIVRAVEGGYVFNLKLKAGTKTIKLREYSEDGYADIDLSTLEILDYETERAKWIESLIDEYTTESMTPAEKMDAICEYLEDAFVYSPIVPYKDGFMYINLLSETGEPFERLYWDSAESPFMLRKIAERLGFENIINLTGDMHAWITADYDGETYSYTVCPPVKTGYVEEIKYVDFSQY